MTEGFLHAFIHHAHRGLRAARMGRGQICRGCIRAGAAAGCFAASGRPDHCRLRHLCARAGGQPDRSPAGRKRDRGRQRSRLEHLQSSGGRGPVRGGLPARDGPHAAAPRLAAVPARGDRPVRDDRARPDHLACRGRHPARRSKTGIRSRRRKKKPSCRR